MQIKYIIEDNGQTIDDAFEFETNWTENNLEELAEATADNYYSEHEGWDASWPLTFQLFTTKKNLGRFKIQLEFDPLFLINTLPLVKEK
jgi:hypothetical protein